MTTLQCIEALKGFSAISSKELSFKSSFYVAQNITKLEEVVKPFEQERNKFIETLRSKTFEEDGKPKVSDEAAKQFQDDVQELLDQKHRIKITSVQIPSDLEGVDANSIKGCIKFLKMV